MLSLIRSLLPWRDCDCRRCAKEISHSASGSVSRPLSWGMLEQSVHQGAVRRFQRMRALNLDQLGSLWKAVVIGLLLDRETRHGKGLSLVTSLNN